MYTLTGSSYFLDGTIGAPAILTSPLNRTVTAPTAPAAAYIPAAMRAQSPITPLPTTRVGTLPTYLNPAVRVAAAAARMPAPPITATRTAVRTQAGVFKIPTTVIDQAREARARASAGVPAGGSTVTPPAPIESVALTPAPSMTATVSPTSAYSLVPTDGAGGGGSAPAATTGDASADEVAKLQGELAPARASTGGAKFPPMLLIAGGAIALLWLFSRGPRGKSIRLSGGKAGW